MKIFLFTFIPVSPLLLPILFTFLDSNMMFDFMKSILRFRSMTVAFWANVIIWTLRMVFLTEFSLIRNSPFRFFFLFRNGILIVWVRPSVWLWFDAIIWTFKNIFCGFCLRLGIWHIRWTILVQSEKIRFWYKFLSIWVI